jgi:glutamine synthetase
MQERDIGPILKRANDDKVELVLLQFTDLHGNIKSLMIPGAKLSESLEKGTWFDGSSIEGFTRIHESDMYLLPDPDTYAILSWGRSPERIARFICDVHTPDNQPFEGDPRYILKKAVGKAHELGLEFYTGPELEFYLFKNESERTRPLPHDSAGYFDFSPRDMASRVRRDIILALQAIGIVVETSHHEVGPGQHEIDFRYGTALESADNCITFKHAVKSIAIQHDLFASFMPKPLYAVSGSGMHVHQSLFYDETGENAMFSPSDEYHLSDVARHFIAGQIQHIKGMLPIVSPTVNSYKRLVPGYEAPVYISWAKVNRSALIRVPRTSVGREQSTRVELRCPDPSCNPYLAFAVMLEAGLDGIKKKLMPPEPVEEDVFGFDDSELKRRNIDILPGSLQEALQELEKDEVIKEALGDHAYPQYLAGKRKEWDEYRAQVTDWEIRKYFEVC